MLSVRVTGTGSFPNLDRRWIEVDCPQCRLATPVTLGDVRLGTVAICRGCKANIHLVDHLGEYQRFKRNFDRTLQTMLDRLARR